MGAITKGKFVELAYQIFIVENGNDTLIYEFKKDKPDRMVFGHEPGLLEAFTNHLEGLNVGDEFDFILAPIEAFGEKDPSMIVTVEKSIFEVEGEFDSERVYEGAFVPMMTADGMRIEGIVKEIADDTVTLDFNHQLAGETVRYKGEVLAVRDATEEELAPRHCGGGCEGCEGCGDDKDGCEGHADGDCCGKGQGHGECHKH